MSAIGNQALRRGLPANVEAEEMVLGSCLLAGEILPEVSERLAAASFMVGRHQTVFAAMVDLVAEGQRIEYVTLANRLEATGELEAVGGVSWIAGLTDGMPRLDSVASYAEIVAEKARLRRIVEIAEGVAQSALSQDAPAADIAGRASSSLLEIDDKRTGDAATLREALQDAPTRGRILDPHRQGDGLRTGFSVLDQLTGGLQPANMVILAARPSTGKTSLALNVAVAAARQAPVLYFTLESSRDALFRRMLCAEARVDSARHRAGMLTPEENARVRKALAAVVDLPLRIAEASGSTVERITATARRAKAQGGLGLVVVDYLQLLASSGRSENRTQEVSAFSRGLQRLAAELRVPVLALSQLSRAPEQRADPRPRLSDLRESGAIEQDADLILFIFRPELYQPDRADLEGLADLELAKHRDGPTGMIALTFLRHCTRFETRAMEADDAAA